MKQIVDVWVTVPTEQSDQEDGSKKRYKYNKIKTDKNRSSATEPQRHTNPSASIFNVVCAESVNLTTQTSAFLIVGSIQGNPRKSNTSFSVRG